MSWSVVARWSSAAVIAAALIGSAQAAPVGQRKKADVTPKPVVQRTSKTHPAGGRAFARMSLAELDEAMAAEFAKPENSAKFAGEMGLSPENLPLMIEYVRTLYADRRLAHVVAEQIYRHQDTLDEATAEAKIARLSEESILRLQSQGLASADDELIRRMLALMVAIPRFTNAAECKAVFGGGGEAVPEYLIMARMGPAAFKDYLAILQSAISLGLSGAKIMPLTQSQEAGAQAAFEKQVVADARNLSETEARQLGMALQDLDRATPDQACKAIQAIIAAAVAMPGQEGVWFRRNYMINLEKDDSSSE